MKKRHLLSLLLVNAAIGAVWFFSYRGIVSSDELPPLPVVELRYSTQDPTNRDVTVDLISADPIHMVNNDRSFRYVFTENGTFTFVYRDAHDREMEATAAVDNIDKTAPTATLENVPSSGTHETTASILVRGADVVAYRYRLNGGEYSEERSPELAVDLADLTPGTHTVEVIGRDAVGNWQSGDTPTAFSWEIRELTREEKFAMRPRASAVGESHKAIEVSIAEQHMWVYEGDQLYFHTPITTGATTKGWATEPGSFRITQMHENKWFEGGYFSDYWMRFNRGMGIHDASWRRDFGSQNYKWTGSHGCVNTPVDLMPKLYEWSEIGTRVLVF
jgi:hypothetical protein